MGDASTIDPDVQRLRGERDRLQGVVRDLRTRRRRVVGYQARLAANADLQAAERDLLRAQHLLAIARGVAS